MDSKERHRAELIAKVTALHEAGETRRKNHNASHPDNAWLRITRAAAPRIRFGDPLEQVAEG